MDLTQKIKLLAPLFDEDEIVKQLKITHAAYRAAVYPHGAEVPLTRSAAHELYHDTTVSNIKPLARKYRCSYNHAHKVLNGTYLDRREVEKLRDLGLSREEIAKKLGVNIRRIVLAPRGVPLVDQINTLVDKGYTAADIAEALDVSPSYVYTHWKNRKASEHTYRKRKTRQQWDEIIEYANMHTAAEAARKFDVSRTSIIYHSKK